VAITRADSGKARCGRAIAAGSLVLSGPAGRDKLRFQGRLPGAKSLKPGNYSVRITARDSRGVRSAPQSLDFTIVSG